MLRSGATEMDELTEYSSAVVEFRGALPAEKQKKYVDNCTGTSPLPPSKDVAVETTRQCDTATQTEMFAVANVRVDEAKLAAWLRRIYPSIEAKLLKGPTPLLDGYGIGSSGGGRSSFSDDTQIQTYQKITTPDTVEHSQGLATWLAVHTNNAPALVVTTSAPHDDWCEHLKQSLKVYVPRRVESGGNFVVFTESASVPVKACLASLATNSFSKSVFAGSTMDGDIYVWQYEHNNNNNNNNNNYSSSSSSSSSANSNIGVRELFRVTSPHGYAVTLDWCAENRLLSAHSNGVVVQWLTGKQMLQEAEFHVKDGASAQHAREITALASIGSSDFVVGTKDGGVYHCRSLSLGGSMLKKQIETRPLRRHLFMVSTLLRTKLAGRAIVVSCDLSGQVYYHDIQNTDAETTASLIVQIPLPFKNAIACSPDANVIYCPGADGSLECYHICDGWLTSVKGALNGKGSLIRSSDNGCWIITGLYGNEFQIFYVEN